MAAAAREAFDAIIVGGGIAGNALATVLARAGKSTMVLERSSVYRDRVRGEYFQPWGVAEARRLGLHAALVGAGGNDLTRFVPYDETMEPMKAEAEAVALDGILPDVPGSLGVGHPQACEALARAASEAGAQVLRGVEVADVQVGRAPSVRYRVGGAERIARCRLVVGADGRESTIRRQAGIPLHATEPRLRAAGLLVEDLRDWPEHQVTIGTEGDLVFFVIPQGDGRARLYLMYPAEQRQRFAGTGGPQAFVDSLAFSCIPQRAGMSRARPAGPCAAFPMNDTWTDQPFGEGLALIGDAAGYSDPHIGQGLSLAMRDVRVLSELLLSEENWSPASLGPYAHERAERMRRLRFCNAVATDFRGEFGAEARERRRRARARMAAKPELGLWRRAILAGPEMVPSSAFDERIREHLFAPVAQAGLGR
jgi:2-polyprenyl-6-methoxyphenol hydroxylase-like FAD-dependent oxidoreductase